MKAFPVTKHSRLAGKSLILMALLVAGLVATSSAVAGHKRTTTTTIVRETVYHTPVYHSSSVIIPISNSVYVGLGNGYINTGHSHTTVYREVSRHDQHQRNHGYQSHGYQNHGYQNHSYQRHSPARGRWSGANKHRDVIYVDRNGRKGSSYREAERRSVVIRERSR